MKFNKKMSPGVSTFGAPEDTVDATEPRDANGFSPQDRTIGAIIAQAKHLSPGQIEQILLHQRAKGVRFGEAAVALKFVSNDDVLWALSQQFHYPYAISSERPMNRQLVAATNPFGEQAESFRDLRSQLMQGVLGADGPRRALAVVSPNRGDGKTFIAANLAVAFSQLGGRTLLVDCDMRTPRQHDVFGIDHPSGLSNILSGRSESNAIHPVRDLPSLFVMPVGTVPPNPLELTQRPVFTVLIHELLSKFDHVIVDTPAMSQGSDARVIAVKCGAALAVGRKGTSRMEEMKTLAKSLVRADAKMAGLAMNEW